MIRIVCFVLTVFFSQIATSASCPDAGLFGQKLFSKFCWDCLFPIRMSGITIDGPGSGSGGFPDGHLNDHVCFCPDKAGVPEIGIPLGGWFPVFITETITKPYCSPSLGGISLAGETRIAVGGDVQKTRTVNDRAVSDSAFLHFHTFSFPIVQMLELFMEADCNPDGYVDMELQYISEPDPLWNDNLLSAIITPEAFLFTNPAAMLVCTAECNTISSDPDGLAHWCAGCWGGVYPFVGHANHNGSTVKHTSLIATKALAALHRRLLAYRTYGEDAACKKQMAPTLTKEQYRLGMFFPSPEATTNHPLGESTLLWGESRNRASSGSNHVYVGYRYQDCCLR